MAKFQSTLPVRGATVLVIVALLMTIYFNPRSPCGERRNYSGTFNASKVFQSTLPVRGATQQAVYSIQE